MGAQLTTNYSNIKQTFTYDIWKIHSATHKTTNESVSLWIIDTDRFSKTYTTRQEKDQYFDLCLQSIQNIRKLRHPRILKILEVNEKKPDIAFASEPVTSCINALSEKMHPMDASYISLQVAEVLGFLNQDARLAHLGLSPGAVVLNEEMMVKLIHFQWASPISQEDLVSVPDKLYSAKVFTEYRFKPPEVLSKKEVRSSADVFIYGLFMYSLFAGESLFQGNQLSEIVNEMPTRLCNIYNVPSDVKNLLQNCLSLEPTSRPSFLEILQNPAFQSMQLKSLRYLDMILTKDPSDKFKFYKGLATKIDDFSPNLSKIKILPILIKECKNDVRFAPILLGPILKISAHFSNPEFMRTVWTPLSFLTNVTSPPEVSISLLKNIKDIMNKIDKAVHKDFIYPIVFTALQSPDPRIHRECLPQLHFIIDEMNETGIRGQILPRVLDLASNSSDMKIASNAIYIVRECLSKIDNDAFATDNLPRLAQIWQKAKNAQVGFAIVETIEILKASNDIMMTKAIPIASEILGSHSIEGDVKNRLCDWMISVIRKFKEQIPGDNYSVTKASSDADNPFSQVTTSSTTQSDSQTSQTTQNTTQQKPKQPYNQDMFSASDIFGPSKSNTNSQSSNIGNQKNQNFSAVDVFGSSTSQSKQGNIDVFGSSSSQSKQGNIDVFGSSSKQGSIDVFNQPQKPAQKSGMDAMDIFGPPSSSTTNSSFNQPKPSPFQVAAGVDIFGSPSSSQQPSQIGGNNPFKSQNQSNSNVFRSNNDMGFNSGQGRGYNGGGFNGSSGGYTGNSGGFMGGSGGYTGGNQWNGGNQNLFGQQNNNQMGNNFYGQQNNNFGQQQNNRPGQNNNNNDLIGSLF